MSISYEGIGAWCATFAAGTGAEEGKVVKVSANGTVSKCVANDGFCGVVAAMGRDGKACSVQLGGLVRVPYSGETAPAVGWNLLAADGNGGVSVVTSGGHSYLAVEVDTTGKTMTIML